MGRNQPGILHGLTPAMHAGGRHRRALPVPICRAGFIAMLINFNKLMAIIDINTMSYAQNRTLLAEIEQAHTLFL